MGEDRGKGTQRLGRGAQELQDALVVVFGMLPLRPVSGVDHAVELGARNSEASRRPTFSPLPGFSSLHSTRVGAFRFCRSAVLTGTWPRTGSRTRS